MSDETVPSVQHHKGKNRSYTSESPWITAFPSTVADTEAEHRPEVHSKARLERYLRDILA